MQHIFADNSSFSVGGPVENQNIHARIRRQDLVGEGLRRAVILVPGKAVEKMTTFSISAFDSAYSLQQIFWLLRLLSKYVFNKFLQSLQRKSEISVEFNPALSVHKT